MEEKGRRIPYGSAIICIVILAGCILIPFLFTNQPGEMNAMKRVMPPDTESYFTLFGTDTLGRSLFLMIWNGGRISLLIGCVSALISAMIGIIYGCISGMAGRRGDALLMRTVEIFMSIPSIILVLFIKAILPVDHVLGLCIAIGSTGWFEIAKAVRIEVRQLQQCEFMLAAKMIGAGWWARISRHLLPNVLPTVFYMMVINIVHAIMTESTLSFLGFGLPTDIISWGSMLAMSEKAFFAGGWWLVIVPGIFLVGTLVSIMEIGNYYKLSVRFT